MLGVIEFHVEGFVEARGETLQRWIVAADVSVADNAHRNRGRRELTSMTLGAGFVTREARRCRVIASFMTRVAGEGTVSLAIVQEF